MCINQKKSAILLRVRGSFAQRWLRHHQLKRDTGPHLRIRTPKGRQYEFPLKEHHVYLGVKISYYSSAKHTVAHRIQAANHAWQSSSNPLLTYSVRCVETTCNLESHSDTHSDVWTGRVGARPQRHLSNAASTYQAGSRDHSPLCASQQGFYPGTTPPFSPVYSSRHVAQGSACTASSAPDKNLSSMFTEDHLASARDTAATMQAWQLQQWSSSQSTTPSPSVEAPFQCHHCGKAYCTYRLLRVHESAEHSQKAPKTDEVLFDRALHSLNGLPTCRLCHHVFRQWDNLKQHIRRKRCPCLRGSPTSMPHTETACEIQPMMGSDETAASLPITDVAAPAATTVRELQPPNAALPVDPTSVPNSPPSVPLTQQQETLQLLQAGRWVELASNRNVQQYLQHHCPVCYQWCADAVGLKHHMAHVHSSWLASRADMQHLLEAFRRAIVLPCRYCKQSRVNKDRHYLQCPVLSICAYLQVWYDTLYPGPNGSRFGGGQIFRSNRRPGDLAAHQAAETGGRIFDLSDDQGKRQREERERDRQRQGVNSSTNVGLHQWFRRVGAPMAISHAEPSIPSLHRRGGIPPAASAEPDSASTSARTDDCIPSSGRDPLSLREDRPRQHRDSAPPNSREVETREGRLPSDTDVLAEDCHVQATDDRASRPPDGCSQDSGRDGKGEEAQLGGRTRPLASSEVEPTETRTTSGRGQTNGADRRPVEADCRATQRHQRGGLAPVQELQEDDRSANHGVDAVSPGDLTAPARGPGVEHVAELGGTGGVAPAGLSPAAGEATVQRPGGPSTAGLLDSSRELSLNAILKLNLYNRSNLCYLNTSVLATTWALLQLQRHGTTDLALHSCFHALASGSTRPAATQVAQLLQWRLMLGQWPQLGRQHDICEFLNYLVPRCLRWAHGALIPKWEARRHRNGHLCVLDSGTTHLPLPIPLCSGEVCHLQWCVDAWHQQGSVHALTHPAPLVCLQLLRFHNEDGVMRK